MKKVLVLLVLMLVFNLSGCGDEQENEKKGLIAGENAFEWGVNIKCSLSDAVKFYVEPTTEDIRASVEERWAEGGMKSGTFGTTALVAGKKKGENAELDGSFTIYVNDTNGPSVTSTVQGKYYIDELPGYENSYFYIYTEDGFKQVTKQEWNSFKTNPM